MFPNLRPKLKNRDGTLNVYCPLCSNFICKVSAEARFTTAICAVCDAERSGVFLTPEMRNQLRHRSTQIQYANPTYDAMLERPVSREEQDDLIEKPGYFFKVFTRLREKLADVINPNTLASSKLAKQKRPPRIMQLPSDDEE